MGNMKCSPGFIMGFYGKLIVRFFRGFNIHNEIFMLRFQSPFLMWEFLKGNVAAFFNSGVYSRKFVYRVHQNLLKYYSGLSGNFGSMPSGEEILRLRSGWHDKAVSL